MKCKAFWLNIILGVYIRLKSPFKSIDWAKQSTAFSLGKLHRIKDLHPSLCTLKETLISYSWAGARSGQGQLKVKHKISSCCWLNCNTNWTPNLTSRAPLHQLKRFPYLVEMPGPLQLLMAIPPVLGSSCYRSFSHEFSGTQKRSCHARQDKLFSVPALLLVLLHSSLHRIKDEAELWSLRRYKKSL